MKKSMIKTIHNNEYIMFVNIPGVKGPEWPSRI
jgi:hypothetical protein